MAGREGEERNDLVTSSDHGRVPPPRVERPLAFPEGFAEEADDDGREDDVPGASGSGAVEERVLEKRARGRVEADLAARRLTCAPSRKLYCIAEAKAVWGLPK